MQTLISWSQVLSNKSLPKSKTISRLNPLALNVQCKTFRFCKAGKIVSKFIFLLFTFYTRSLYCLIFQSYDWWNQRQETEIRLPLQTLSAILFLSPDLSRRREHFLNKKKKLRERWECKLIFYLLLLLTLEQRVLCSFVFWSYDWGSRE